jgi:hypothetical protein
MAASLEDVLTLLRNWKKSGNRLRIKLSQSGRMFVEGDVSIDATSDNKQVVFAFGLSELAWGTVVIPLTTDFVRFTILTPEDHRPLEPIAPDFDKCLEFAWFISGDRCVVCSVVNTARRST